MGTANHIGRLGVLAVALGIGSAIATPACIAVAAPSDSASSTDQITGGKSSGPARKHAATQRASSAASASVRGGDRSAATPAPAATVAAPAAAAKSQNSAAPSAAVSVRVTVPVARQNPTKTVGSAPAAAAAKRTAAAQAVAPTAAAIVTVQPTAAAPAAPQDPFQQATHAITQAAAQFMNAVLSPLLVNGPLNDPGQAPVLWTVLAWARRELGMTAPLGSPQASVSVSGLSENLLANGDAEFGDPSKSGNSAVSIPGWTLTGTPTVIAYNTPRNMWPLGTASPNPNLPAFMGFPTGTDGEQFFGGGNVADATLTQLIDLGENYNAAGQTFSLSGQLGGWLINPGKASIQVDFLDSNQAYLDSASIGPVTLWDRFFQTKLLDRSTTGALPTDTRYAKVTVNLDAWTPLLPGLNADYNSAFADNVSFQVSGLDATTPDPVPLESAVGELDHVFMVYMENKGFDDIYLSPNAPFLNSLISAYGFANNYYGLTHGSLPNYYPIVGGEDFGITYNCAAPCMDPSLDDTLVGRIDDKFGGTTVATSWRSYAQSLAYGANPLESSGDYAVDETPFPAFTAIANDPAYAAEHIVPLEQMAIDLRSTATTPKFAWFAANEDFNGEGPVDFPWGMLKFAWSQISPGHQYNVPALDQYLSETVPTILNSASWNTDTVDNTNKSVLVITFDEDNNNTSLGFGNEGNHIVTVVIPNQDAIDSGMRSGPFIDSTHYNHYSLLNMIETSLGLPTDYGWLTKNDEYATPMNGFWTGLNQGSKEIAL